MIGRVSTFQSVERAVFSVQTASSRVDAAQRRVSTGKQLTQPSDDPTGTSQTLNFRKRISDLEQYDRTMDQAKGFMATSESALENVSLLVRQARQLAVQAASDTVGNEGRQGIANQIQNIITQVGNLGNSAYGSRYVFGGQRTQNPPFLPDGASFIYQGGKYTDGNDKLILDIGQGEEIVTNVTGEAVFTGILDDLRSLRNHVASNDVRQTSHDDLAKLDVRISSLLNVRAELGSKIQLVDQTKNRNEALKLSFTDFVSKIEDADLPKSITELQTAQLSYQAALQATASGFKSSLLDYVR